MVIYNVTTKVDWAIHNAWQQWMLTEHIPEIIATGCFEKCLLLRLLEVDDTDGPSFAAQYITPTKEGYLRYIEQHAAGMRLKATEKWGNKVVAFRSLLELVQ
jgi:hypothetical protein